MADRSSRRTTASGPSGHSWASYFREARRPLVSLVFLLPMLLVYEGGLLLLTPARMPRNGADVWLRAGLERLGFYQYLLLPVLTCLVLLSWHFLRREPWRVPWWVCGGMALESLAYASGFLLLAHAYGAYFPAALRPALAAHDLAAWTRCAAYCGAGIYEEVLFRALLLTVVAGALRYLGARDPGAAATAVLVTSLIFAAAHCRLDLMLGSQHIVTAFGEPFSTRSFLFRTLAGIGFSVIFLQRGLGVAAGSHALYDILVDVSS